MYMMFGLPCLENLLVFFYVVLNIGLVFVYLSPLFPNGLLWRNELPSLLIVVTAILSIQVVMTWS